MPILPAFILNNWKLLLGGVALLGVLIYVAILRADANHWHKLADSYQAQLASCKAAVELQNAHVDALAREGQARATAAEQALETARAATESQGDAIRSLTASAAKSRPVAGCRASEAYQAVREGL